MELLKSGALIRESTVVCIDGGRGCLCTFVLCEHVLSMYLNRLLANEVFAVQHVDEV